MPVPGWEERLLERVIITEVYAVRYYLGADGQSYCDVADPDNGYLAKGCMVIGSRTKPINAPVAEWSPADGIDEKKHPQVLLLRTSPDKQPYVMDLLYNPAALTPPQETDAQTDTQMSNRDHGVGNNTGHRLVVREDGSAAAAVKNFDVVLGGGRVNITDGDLTESAALAGKVFDVLNNVVAVLNDLQAWAAALDTYLIAATAPTPYISGAYASVRQAPRAPTTLTVTLAELQSAVLKLSGRSEEAQGV